MTRKRYPEGAEDLARSEELPRLEFRDRNWEDPTLSAAGVGVHRSTLPAPQVAEDRYVIITELARGGLGRVFRAHDLRLDRSVAIKELISPTPGLRERFMRETAITARLQHPAIVPLYDAGTRKEGPFYVMKLLGSGQTLKERAEASAFDDRLALLPHVIAVADAMAYAHSV